MTHSFPTRRSSDLDVGHILAHALKRRKLMQHTLDLHRGDGGALERGEEDAAQRVAERQAEAALERLGDEGRLAPARSEEHTSELQSLMRISYAVFCLKTKKLIITLYVNLNTMPTNTSNVC